MRGNTGYIHNVAPKPVQAVNNANEKPIKSVNGSHILHIVEDGTTQVWLNMEEHFDGSIIGLGDTRKEALDDAHKTLLKLIVGVAELKQGV